MLPLAISKGTCLLVRPSPGWPARIYSSAAGEKAELEPDGLARRGDWVDYIRGVLLVLRQAGHGPPPFDALYFGDLPLEAGLSSSASLEVVTAVALQVLEGDKAVDLEEAARVGWRAENEFVGMPCGAMDQYAVALARPGRLLLLDCSNLEYRHVPFRLEEEILLVGHTGVRRSLCDSDYGLRRRECEEALELISGAVGERESLSRVTPAELDALWERLPETPRMRARHVIHENLRVEEAVMSLERGDPRLLGDAMNRSHASLRDLYRVSCPELDILQEISLDQEGVWGCRMTGAGFGGCVIALLRRDALPAYLDSVPDRYREATGREPFFLETVPAGGAAGMDD